MGIDRAGWPFILGALVVAVAVGFWLGRAWSVPFLILGAFFLFFFRDPDRNPPKGDHLVLSPADARVMVAGATVWPGAPEGEWQVVSMFLSPMDVHVNRMPVGGRVTKVRYHPGRFLPAYRPDAGSTGRNSATSTSRMWAVPPSPATSSATRSPPLSSLRLTARCSIRRAPGPKPRPPSSRNPS